MLQFVKEVYEGREASVCVCVMGGAYFHPRCTRVSGVFISNSQFHFKRFDLGVCEDVARSEEDRDEEGGKGRHEADRHREDRPEAGRQEAGRAEAGRQEEQSEGEVREDKDEERGAENSDMAFTRHQFSKTNQPDPKLIAKQSLAKYTLSFQTQWYQKSPWLHVSPGVEGVLCFYCSKAFNSETSPLAKNADSAFISSGFKNWKKALERFTVHERSDSVSVKQQEKALEQ